MSGNRRSYDEAVKIARKAFESSDLARRIRAKGIETVTGAHREGSRWVVQVLRSAKSRLSPLGPERHDLPLQVLATIVVADGFEEAIVREEPPGV